MPWAEACDAEKGPNSRTEKGSNVRTEKGSTSGGRSTRDRFGWAASLLCAPTTVGSVWPTDGQLSNFGHVYYTHLYQIYHRNGRCSGTFESVGGPSEAIDSNGPPPCSAPRPRYLYIYQNIRSIVSFLFSRIVLILFIFIISFLVYYNR